jgi:hypothetical protein
MSYKIFAINIASYLNFFETKRIMDVHLFFIFYMRSNDMELAMGSSKYIYVWWKKRIFPERIKAHMILYSFSINNVMAVIRHRPGNDRN